MKYLFYILTLTAFVFYLMRINDTINYKNTQWETNSPRIIHLSSTETQIIFSVTEPATIYWRLYDNNQNLPQVPEDLTNTNTTDQIFLRGGNITQGKNNDYTKTFNNLTPNHHYRLFAIAVSYIGTFPKEIKQLNIITLSN